MSVLYTYKYYNTMFTLKLCYRLDAFSNWGMIYAKSMRNETLHQHNMATKRFK